MAYQLSVQPGIEWGTTKSYEGHQKLYGVLHDIRGCSIMVEHWMVDGVPDIESAKARISWAIYDALENW